MLHSQASLVNLLKNKNISSGIFLHTFVPFSMLVGFEIFKSTNKRKETIGYQDYN